MKLQRWRVVVVVLVLGTCAMRPGMAGAYHYEASSTARVADSVIDVHRVPAPFETLGRGGSAPRPADAQQTYMSPYARGVATEAAIDTTDALPGYRSSDAAKSTSVLQVPGRCTTT
jgi:hypothetical protein